MKKYLSIVCAIAMLISLTGCGSSGSSSKSSSKSSVTSDEKKNDTISIKNYRLSTDSKNNPVLIVDYEFRNNTDEAKSFSSLFYDKAFQNGVKCKGITLIGSKDFDSSANDTEILPGYTYTVNQAYYITDNSDVLIMVTDYFNKTTYLEQTISLENLQIETTTEKATEEVTEAPTEKPTEKITEPVTEPEPETEPASISDIDYLNSLGDIAVDKTGTTVTIVIPAELVNDANQAVEEGKSEGRFISVIANADGSVTYTMTIEEHNKYMEEIRSSINELIQNYVSQCQSITAIEPIDDYTGYNVHVTNPEEYKKNGDYIAITSLVVSSGFYAQFNGKNISMNDIQIHLFDANGNEFEQ
ncbi:MAG: DUF5067 domain-containing protein [Ruminococcus sp.]|nr:DUF5067 domain-containing protein [Ruminococcus sp.]